MRASPVIPPTLAFEGLRGGCLVKSIFLTPAYGFRLNQYMSQPITGNI
jgi:hypothetical protein|tara:strand:- start:1261 stop:1404 length:144 start_codon:yes stop_codon:yes gene_type:complete